MPLTLIADARARLLISGAAVILVGLSLRWYSASLTDIAIPGGRSGWGALGNLDVYLTLIAFSSLGLALAAVRKAGAPPSGWTALTVAATLGLTLVIYRMLSPPGGALPGFVVDESVGLGPLVTAAGLVFVLAGTRWVSAAA